MGKKLNFEVDKFQLLEDSENSQLSTLRMWIVSEGDNRHSIPISWEAILDAKPSLIGKPVLAYHDKLFDKLGGHEKDELAVGVVLRGEDIFEEKDVDGKRWVGANAYLWKKYYPNIIEILKKNDGQTAISMEIEVLDGTDNGEGFEDIKLFSFMGVTLIGCEPAIPNARAEVLQFSKLVKETEKIVESFSSGYRGIDFIIPEEVKATSTKGLKLYETHRKGGNGYSLSMARYITKNESIEPSRVKKLYQSLNNKSKQDLAENTDSHISFMLMGGKASMKWCNDLMIKMSEADSDKLSHFSDETKRTEEKNSMDKTKEEMAAEEVKEEKPFAEEKPVDEKPFAETPAEEKKEDPAEEKKETPAEEKKEEQMAEEPAKEEEPIEEDKEEARMSLDAYADVSAQLAMLEMETEGAKELGSQYVSPKAGEQFAILVSKVKELFEQNITLKEFKTDIEKKQFAHAVESTLADVKEVMPKEKIDECRLNSANFTLETISGWQNEVKALAFTFATDGKKEEGDGIDRFALPFSNLPKKEKSDFLWG